MKSSGKISKNLNINKNYLKKEIGESFDTKYRHFKIPALKTDAMIIYIAGMVDSRVIDETILAPLMTLKDSKFSLKNILQGGKKIKASEIIDYNIFTSAVDEKENWNEICEAVLEGDTILLIDNLSSALVLNTRKYEGRAVNEPLTESEVRSPKDGFVENVQTNAALIRRRIKDTGLRFDNMKIGRRTKTVVSIVYIKGLVNESLLKEVKSRLEGIDTDAIITSMNIEELIEDSPFSIFPTIANSERPDKVSSALLEGRIAILTDNAPFALVIPAVFWQFAISSMDSYEKYTIETFIRWVRVAGLVLSVTLSPLYVLLTSFHQEMLPTALALKIAEGRSGVPFPAFIETILMEIILEIMKEAGLRMPKPIGQTVSIIGSIVVGQAAVTAGLVSPLLVIVIAISAISSYATPSFNMNNTLRFLRFPLLFFSASFGLLGFLGGIILIMLNLMTIRSFGTPYLTPFVPFKKSFIKNVILRPPDWADDKRSDIARPLDKRKQASGSRPKKPVSR